MFAFHSFFLSVFKFKIGQTSFTKIMQSLCIREASFNFQFEIYCLKDKRQFNSKTTRHTKCKTSNTHIIMGTLRHKTKISKYLYLRIIIVIPRIKNKKNCQSLLKIEKTKRLLFFCVEHKNFKNPCILNKSNLETITVT